MGGDLHLNVDIVVWDHWTQTPRWRWELDLDELQVRAQRLKGRRREALLKYLGDRQQGILDPAKIGIAAVAGHLSCDEFASVMRLSDEPNRVISKTYRRGFLLAVRPMSDRIVHEALSWQHRWNAYCGCLQGCAKALGKRATSGATKWIAEEIGGRLAKDVIDTLGSPPITELFQALIYFGSIDPGHRAASVAWQKNHPQELIALQAQHPNIGLLD